MYNQGRKYLLFIIFSSCNRIEKCNEISISYPNNFNNISKTYNAIEDTLNNWINDSLLASKKIFFAKNWLIDSTIIFNNDTSRLFTYVLNKGRKSDYQYDLAGAKINNKWYFFFGTSTIIDRASYQDSIYSPMTFDELSYLARENLSSAFYQDKNGKVKVRESFFDFMDDSNGWGLPPGSTRKDIDSVIVARNKEMRQYKIDPAEIEQIKAEMAKSVRPQEPILDIKWYEKIFPKEKKLFETDEWKEYVKSKNRGK